jgi:hypothetical protein
MQIPASDLTTQGSPIAREPVERIEQVPIDLLKDTDSPRLTGPEAGHVQLLAEAAGTLPPILVHRGTMRVVDGIHRLQAMIRRGHSSVAVEFLEGSLDEAFVTAVQVNARHGLPLSGADRKAAAIRLIDAFPYWADRKIADVAGVSAATVAGLRAGLDAQNTERIGRDGRVRPLDAGQRRRIASELIIRQPDASLRQIASASGISPTTARDVRERLRRGDDPLPLHQRQDPKEDEKEAPTGRATRRRETSPATVESVDVLLRRLQNDPSLRFTESGRALLRWLTRVAGLHAFDQFADAVPPHCRYTLADLARACAEDWQRLAAYLDEAAGKPSR